MRARVRAKCARLPRMPSSLVPGALVRHRDRPDWGIGQVQSAIGDRITINFEHAGKRTVIAGRVALDSFGDEPAGG